MDLNESKFTTFNEEDLSKPVLTRSIAVNIFEEEEEEPCDDSVHYNTPVDEFNQNNEKNWTPEQIENEIARLVKLHGFATDMDDWVWRHIQLREPRDRLKLLRSMINDASFKLIADC